MKKKPSKVTKFGLFAQKGSDIRCQYEMFVRKREEQWRKVSYYVRHPEWKQGHDSVPEGLEDMLGQK